MTRKKVPRYNWKRVHWHYNHFLSLGRSSIQITVADTRMRLDFANTGGAKKHLHDFGIRLAIFIGLQTLPESSEQF